MVVRLVARWVLPTAILTIGAIAAYGMGAGYFSPAGIGVPSPWNYLVTAIVLLLVLALAGRIHAWR